MAGLGRKVWTAGEVLAAADVNGYLADQVVMVFDDEASRGSAIGTAIVSEGMVTYLKDIDQVQVYDGSEWSQISGAGGGGFETNFLLMGA